MNSVIEAIRNRRSIRRYKADQIKDTELDAIIEAGIYAATGHNDQPWHFTVIQNKELLDFMSSKTKTYMLESNIDWVVSMAQKERLHIFYNAPTVVIVSGKNGTYSPLTDCSAAIQNMMVAAESLNIGSVCVGLVSYFFEHSEEVSKLNIPEFYTPYYALCLGYKDLSKPMRVPERRRDVVNYIK